MKDAIALLKELTEENDKLRKAKVVYETVDYCADDLAKALEENERLKNICNSYALQYGTARDKEVFLKKEREDTVKRFAERLKKVYVVDTDDGLYGILDRIAIEMGAYPLVEPKGKTITIPKFEYKEEEECPSCRFFVGCECFDGETCNLYEKNTEEEEK